MPHTNSSELCTASKWSCVTKAIDELASRSLKFKMDETCNCLPSCASVQYDAEILKTMFDFKKAYIINRTAYDKSQRKEDEFEFLAKYNISKVEMYFKEPQFVSMRRSELFGLTDFLANCGGLLGLFLGFSFLSLIEIFYFCTLRLWCTLKKDIKIEKKRFKESMYKK
ncbi:pickpocket protein 28-like [Choristoneura fumiferana]